MMSTNDIAIKISDIHVSFGNHHVLRGASGIIRRGSIVTFLGRNGCGKSTLLKTVTGNLKPQQGSIEIDGRPLSSYSSDEMARVVAFLPPVPRRAQRHDGRRTGFLRPLSLPALVERRFHQGPGSGGRGYGKNKYHPPERPSRGQPLRR